MASSRVVAVVIVVVVVVETVVLVALLLLRRRFEGLEMLLQALVAVKVVWRFSLEEFSGFVIWRVKAERGLVRITNSHCKK